VTLLAGSHLGAYQIVALLGAGGMGEVYRAKDTVLKREVALKVLPPDVAGNPERVARFQREAEVLAALNHPNIAHLYGIEQTNGALALVMELVEGDTLADRIVKKAIPLDEALLIAKQIAEALEAAHEQGIIHRDLKPANIKVRDDGTIKVLDFGLAKAMEQSSVASPSASLTHSPTITSPALMTGVGVVLGTAAYMSPEQARGLPADHRSDVFSFGVVMFEMLGGRRPFAGETVPDVLASILARDPDLNALHQNLDPRLIQLIRRCLEKNPKRRWQAIGDVRVELETIAASPPATADASVRPTPVTWRRIAAIAGSTAIVSALLSAYVTREMLDSPVRPAVMKVTAPLETGQQFTTLGRRALALSPDGRQIAYVADGRLYLRALAQAEAVPIKGTEASSPSFPNNPVFSPDGQSVAYFVSGTIRKVPLSGGTATTLCAATGVLAMSWDEKGILFTEGNAIKRVAPAGGEPQVLYSVMKPVATDVQMLPDGQTLLLALAADPSGSKSRIVAQPLSSSGGKVVVEEGSDPRYLANGDLIFSRGGVLLAARFDPQRLVLASDPVPVLEGVRRGGRMGGGAAQYAVSNSGVLAYLQGPAFLKESQRALMLVDFKGSGQMLDVPRRAYNYPRVSPDGSWLAVDVEDENDASIYVYRLSGGSQIRRLTLTGHSRIPVWSADSRRVTFQSDASGDPALFWQRADGTEPPERLTTATPGTSHTPESWSPDGKTLLFSVRRDNVYELHTYSVDDKRSTPFGGITSVYPLGATFSPDGRLVAYYERDAGTRSGSLFVRPFPNGQRYEVNKGGGIHPFWLNGPEPLRLVYRLPNAVNVVELTTRPDFTLGTQKELSLGALFNPGPANWRNMDVVGSSEQFVTVSLRSNTDDDLSMADDAIHLVINWDEELRQRLFQRR
jgi:serine/threonine-protein kinase